MEEADDSGLEAAARKAGRLRIALVTNIPAPYRVPVLNILAADPGIDLHVFYAAHREPDREWDLPDFSHRHSFLRERFYFTGYSYIHNNPDVFAALRAFNPQVVVTTGFGPTYLYAFAYTQLFRRRHVAMTDGTLSSEATQSGLHRLLRRVVLGRTGAFVVSSEGGRALFRSYGVPDAKIHFSPLCANTSVIWERPSASPELDFLFSGRLVEVKNPEFALEVSCEVAKRLKRRITLGILGSGPLEGHLRAKADAIAEFVDVRFAGHVRQGEIPVWFARTRVFLFPTSWDPWGVVANEACQAGVPVIVSPHAGVAGELVRDGINGYVRPLDLAQWTNVAAELLANADLHARLSHSARVSAAPYNFENAASGIAKAARMALS